MVRRVLGPGWMGRRSFCWALHELMALWEMFLSLSSFYVVVLERGVWVCVGVDVCVRVWVQSCVCACACACVWEGVGVRSFPPLQALPQCVCVCPTFTHNPLFPFPALVISLLRPYSVLSRTFWSPLFGWRPVEVGVVCIESRSNLRTKSLALFHWYVSKVSDWLETLLNCMWLTRFRVTTNCPRCPLRVTNLVICSV